MSESDLQTKVEELQRACELKDEQIRKMSNSLHGKLNRKAQQVKSTQEALTRLNGKLRETQLWITESSRHFSAEVSDTKPMKQVIVMRHDLHMRMGKAIAQGAHASMMWLLSNQPGNEVRLRDWLFSGITKICVRVESEEELRDIIAKAKDAGLLVSPITDAGRTEFGGVPTLTCAAIGPDEIERVDSITGALKLL